MKSAFILLILLVTGLPILHGKDLPQRKDVLTKMVMANDYFMKKWSDPGKDIVTDKKRPSNIWTRATYFEGLMALYQTAPDKRYLDYMLEWGNSHNWGLAYLNDTRNADNMCCGQVYIDLYKIDQKPEYIKALKDAADKMVASDKIDDWWWVDALQMAMPVFARLGALEKDSKYWNRMYDMYLFTKNSHGDKGLYSKEDHLWWRDKDFDPPYAEPNGQDCYWARGNGWAIAAMARVLEQKPPDRNQKKEYATMLKEMAKALVKVQREDGFWNVSLHDPGNFGGPETSGTAFFVYGLAWGINNGYLKKGKYLPAVLKGWKALSEKALHPNGFLGYVQGTGKEPKSSQPVGYDVEPNFDDFGTGAFLLAGREVCKLSK